MPRSTFIHLSKNASEMRHGKSHSIASDCYEILWCDDAITTKGVRANWTHTKSAATVYWLTDLRLKFQRIVCNYIRWRQEATVLWWWLCWQIPRLCYRIDKSQTCIIVGWRRRLWMDMRGVKFIRKFVFTFRRIVEILDECVHQRQSSISIPLLFFLSSPHLTTANIVLDGM